MEHFVEAALEPSHGLCIRRPTPLELQIWVELPFRRPRFPIQRKPSVAVSLRPGIPVPHVEEATTQRVPSHRVEAGVLGIGAAFVGVLALGLLGRGLERLLLWWL